MSFALKQVVGCPTGKQCTQDTGNLESGYRPSGILDRQSPALSQEFRSPVEDSHTDYINKHVGNTECPNPTVFPNHYHLKFLAGFGIFFFVVASQICTGKIRQLHVFRLIAQSCKYKDRSCHCQTSRNPEAPFPSADVLSVLQCLLCGISNTVI